MYRRGSVLYRRGSGARALYEGKPGLGPCKGKGLGQQFIMSNGHMGPLIVDRMTDSYD